MDNDTFMASILDEMDSNELEAFYDAIKSGEMIEDSHNEKERRGNHD